jgi:hypothetical protein
VVLEYTIIITVYYYFAPVGAPASPKIPIDIF